MASVVTQQFFSSWSNFLVLRSPFSATIRKTSRVINRPQPRGTTKNRNLIDSKCQSLADRGFLRSLKPYTPPRDVDEKINVVFAKVLGEGFNAEEKIPDAQKFALLKECCNTFNYGIPNSLLHKMVTLKDVRVFYSTPVKITTPLEDMKEIALPPNIHILHEYVRFHPDTDVMFNGISAFPKSPTVVTGLKARKKYKGFTQRLPFNYFNEPLFMHYSYE